MNAGNPWSAGRDGIPFHPLRYSDLRLMHRWLNAPHVARWWYGEDTSWRAIEEYYLPHVEVRETVEPYLILREGTPVGYYIRAYERAGFRFFETIQVPGEPEPEYLMPWTTCSWRGRTASSREDSRETIHGRLRPERYRRRSRARGEAHDEPVMPVRAL